MSKIEPEHLARDRQSNIVPARLISNIARFDAALWRGKGLNSPIQKAGLVVLGLFFFLSGTFYLAVALGILDGEWRWDPGNIYVVISVLALATFALVVGWRLLFNSLQNIDHTHKKVKRGR